jgi:NAD(P)-dependent dehydrogenase (short-subunit alcohol dehydrogenase family)
MSSSSLEGKVAIVTGAARGIGLSAARALAARGAAMVLVDSGTDLEGDGADPAVVEAAAAELRAAGANAIGLALDASRDETAEAAAEHAIATFGRIDALVLSAGIHRLRTVVHASREDVDRVIGVGLLGPVAFVREVGRRMIAQETAGSIVLMSSPVAFFGAQRQSLAAGVGAFTASLVKSAAVELRRHSIRINAIAPTARTRQTAELPLFKSAAETSLGPEHVGNVVAFLVSDAAAEVSGEVIGVAGGRVYALRTRETAGVFFDAGPPSHEELGRRWSEIVR